MAGTALASFPLQLADGNKLKRWKGSSIDLFWDSSIIAVQGKRNQIFADRPAGSVFSTDSVHTHFTRPEVHARLDQALL